MDAVLRCKTPENHMYRTFLTVGSSKEGDGKSPEGTPTGRRAEWFEAHSSIIVHTLQKGVCLYRSYFSVP